MECFENEKIQNQQLEGSNGAQTSSLVAAASTSASESEFSAVSAPADNRIAHSNTNDDKAPTESKNHQSVTSGTPTLKKPSADPTVLPCKVAGSPQLPNTPQHKASATPSVTKPSLRLSDLQYSGLRADDITLDDIFRSPPPTPARASKTITNGRDGIRHSSAIDTIQDTSLNSTKIDITIPQEKEASDANHFDFASSNCSKDIPVTNDGSFSVPLQEKHLTNKDNTITRNSETKSIVDVKQYINEPVKDEKEQKNDEGNINLPKNPPVLTEDAFKQLNDAKKSINEPSLSIPQKDSIIHENLQEKSKIHNRKNRSITKRSLFSDLSSKKFPPQFCFSGRNTHLFADPREVPSLDQYRNILYKIKDSSDAVSPCSGCVANSDDQVAINDSLMTASQQQTSHPFCHHADSVLQTSFDSISSSNDSISSKPSAMKKKKSLPLALCFSTRNHYQFMEPDAVPSLESYVDILFKVRESLNDTYNELPLASTSPQPVLPSTDEPLTKTRQLFTQIKSKVLFRPLCFTKRNKHHFANPKHVPSLDDYQTLLFDIRDRANALNNEECKVNSHPKSSICDTKKVDLFAGLKTKILPERMRFGTRNNHHFAECKMLPSLAEYKTILESLAKMTSNNMHITKRKKEDDIENCNSFQDQSEAKKHTFASNTREKCHQTEENATKIGPTQKTSTCSPSKCSSERSTSLLHGSYDTFSSLSKRTLPSNDNADNNNELDSDCLHIKGTSFDTNDTSSLAKLVADSKENYYNSKKHESNLSRKPTTVIEQEHLPPELESHRKKDNINSSSKTLAPGLTLRSSEMANQISVSKTSENILTLSKRNRSLNDRRKTDLLQALKADSSAISRSIPSPFYKPEKRKSSFTHRENEEPNKIRRTNTEIVPSERISGLQYVKKLISDLWPHFD